MKKFTVTIVDTKENLELSSKIIPDGIIAKVKGSKEFKIGDGLNTFSNLPAAGATLNVDVDKVPLSDIKGLNFESFDTHIDINGILTIKNLTWFDGGSYDLPLNTYSRHLDGKEIKINN